MGPNFNNTDVYNDKTLSKHTKNSKKIKFYGSFSFDLFFLILIKKECKCF